MTKQKSYIPGTHPNLPPPRSEAGLLGWMRQNLFATWSDTFLTLFGLYVLYSFLPDMVSWMFFEAVWSASSRKECWAAMSEPMAGACWAFVKVRFNQFLYGFYPSEELWRVNLSFVMLFVALAPVLFDRVPGRKQLFLFTALFPFIAGWLIFGGFALNRSIRSRSAASR